MWGAPALPWRSSRLRPARRFPRRLEVDPAPQPRADCPAHAGGPGWSPDGSLSPDSPGGRGADRHPAVPPGVESGCGIRERMPLVRPRPPLPGARVRFLPNVRRPPTRAARASFADRLRRSRPRRWGRGLVLPPPERLPPGRWGRRRDAAPPNRRRGSPRRAVPPAPGPAAPRRRSGLPGRAAARTAAGSHPGRPPLRPALPSAIPVRAPRCYQDRGFLLHSLTIA